MVADDCSAYTNAMRVDLPLRVAVGAFLVFLVSTLR